MANRIDWLRIRSFFAHLVGLHAYYTITRNGEPAKICYCGRYKDEEEWVKNHGE